YPEMIAPDVCRAVIEAFETDPRKRPGEVIGRGQAKRSVDLHVRALPEWESLCRRLDEGIVASLRRYREEVENFRDIHTKIQDTGYQIQRYLPNGVDGFAWHADARDAASCHRFLAMIAYLNTVDEGGATEFRAQGVSIAPRAGSVLWFPPGFEYV